MTSPESSTEVVEQLRALEAQGDTDALSRNRHFDYFSHGVGKAVWLLRRRLERLESLMCTNDSRRLAAPVTLAAPGIQVKPVPGDAGDVRLVITLPAMAARAITHLTRAEFTLLLERPNVREAMTKAGLTHWLA